MGQRLSVYIILCLTLVGCSNFLDNIGSDLDERVSPTYDGPDEVSYCSLADAVVYSPKVTITGTAEYQARELTGSGLGNAGAAKPIRYAEVRVTNSNGTVVQCAETDVNGDFSFDLPDGGATYQIAVNARADNNYVKVSVLDTPEYNNVYALTTSVVADVDKSVGTLNAGVTGNVLGGAFNIYDQILNANEFLRTEVGTCSIAGCTDFTVAPKVSAYWKKGFNPNSYYGAPSSGVSFYIPNYNRLFILGGINGDVDYSDTDHFDNTIIIHEYAHFLEDNLSISDSYGGPHSGTTPIDPRLAWSEGFANFLQAAVTNDPRYIDTEGNIDGAADILIESDLENYGSCSNFSDVGCDKTSVAGEGNFREFAITRYLWDAHDTTDASDDDSSGSVANDNIANKFEEIWAAFVKSDGMNNNNAAYQSVGLFNYVQDSVIALSDWTDLRANHSMVEDTYLRRQFAHYLDNTDTCSMNFSISPTVSQQSHKNSDFLTENDFFHYKHSGGTMNLTLQYTTAAGTEVDLDLYLYSTAKNFFSLSTSSDDYIDKSWEEPNGTTGDVEVESISRSLPAGDYLINVFAYDGDGDATSFELLVNGDNLCPTALP